METITQINKALLVRLYQLEKFIGNTPLKPIETVFKHPKVSILAKLEWNQLGGSVKARPAFNIIKQAILSGQLDENRQLLDASSGNTAIAYAHIAAALGLSLTIVLPENASKERKLILKSLGTKLIFTSPYGGTDESQEKALEISLKHPHQYYYADQYSNPNNYLAHIDGTAKEIWKETNGTVTHFVVGLGTTGTFRGTTEGLKVFNPNLKAIALQPNSPMHGMEGWKHLETAKVPTIYKNTLADQFIEVDTEKAYQLIKDVAQKEGLLISPSAAANLLGAIEVASSLDSGTVVTVFADNADKYGDVLEFIFK